MFSTIGHFRPERRCIKSACVYLHCALLMLRTKLVSGQTKKGGTHGTKEQSQGDGS
jgi:hypothetical protein